MLKPFASQKDPSIKASCERKIALSARNNKWRNLYKELQNDAALSDRQLDPSVGPVPLPLPPTTSPLLLPLRIDDVSLRGADGRRGADKVTTPPLLAPLYPESGLLPLESTYPVFGSEFDRTTAVVSGIETRGC